MKELKFLKIILILLINIIITRKKCMGAPPTFIEGVKQICTNQQGQLGRCISSNVCQRSIKPTNNTACSSDKVCCRLGPGIVYPDNDNEIEYTSAKQTNLIQSTGRIHFPNEHGQFDATDRVIGQVASVLNTTAAPDDRLGSDDSQWYPKPPVCGPMIVSNKIYGGTEAALGEFPWLVNLEYRTPNNTLVIACAGNIINHRYILTAAHCVKGLVETKVGILESIRAGDHNLEELSDCDDDGCIDPFQRLAIIRKIVYDKYSVDRKSLNDIALLKTDREIQFSFSVAPVCMPGVFDNFPPLDNKSRLAVAGWGANELYKFSAEKRIVDVPYVKSDECPFKLQENQMCAGGERGKDSCNGDSGGALAMPMQSGWVIVGIVSSGRGCGRNPGIYTRVNSFQTWIKENIDAY